MASRDLNKKSSYRFATRRRLRLSPDIKSAARISNSRKDPRWRGSAYFAALRSRNPRQSPKLGCVAFAAATAAPLLAKISNAMGDLASGKSASPTRSATAEGASSKAHVSPPSGLCPWPSSQVGPAPKASDPKFVGPKAPPHSSSAPKALELKALDPKSSSRTILAQRRSTCPSLAHSSVPHDVFLGPKAFLLPLNASVPSVQGGMMSSR
ncbi:hypothetical protein AXG93_960s1050 [Marchantia polymorpha subsp. ruderalis]|uniref:Uncharacterized protein n=1 Tax=Marchantia polymorpha subsp. ruderalis TaxID=1480154 RepID=A0A176VGV5_MARPO|nr:hypothetical protein AXG93_960s1050 [Marchantia polymorpha subsp. ruderalis]